MNESQDFSGRAVVKFTATYCAPCRQLAPVLAELSAKYAERVRMVVVDIEEQPEVAQRFGIRSIPTLLAFRDGQVVEQQTGYSNPKRVERLFEDLAAVTTS